MGPIQGFLTGGGRAPVGRALLLLGLFVLPGAGAGQDPPPPEIPLPEVQVPDDEEPREPDEEEEEEEVVLRVPRAGTGLPAGWETGVWVWDREALQNARALTLAELLYSLPGAVFLRGGDYGQPTGITAFGFGPGSIRIFRDGTELPPLDGGVVDLSRVGMAGLDEVRVERRSGELQVHLRSLELLDPRPYTLLEVGTGDLNTNLFRGTFGHPRVAGGHFMIALDRVDTQGPLRAEPGVSFGATLGYTTFIGDRASLTWDLRRMTSRRPPELWSPRNVDRTDWALRGRYRLADGVVASAFFQRSSLGLESELEPGDPAFALVNQESRRQAGVELALNRDWIWARTGLRDNGGPGWPESSQFAEGGIHAPTVGGVTVSAEREAWTEESNVRVHGRVWTRPLLGISLFAEVDEGRRGVPRFIPPGIPPAPNGENGENGENGDPPEEPPPLPPVSFVDRSGIRAGAQFRREGLRLGGALLRVEAGALHPTGLPLDRGATPVPGGRREGFEVSARIPLTLLLEGLALEGAAQFWDGDGEWVYLPLHNHDARVSYQKVFLESRNLEVWADVGVRGRDGMTVFVGEASEEPGMASVPSYQSWFARVQVRVAAARIFIDWENFTIRDGNMDFPERNLLSSRTLFGVRWTMWN
jgi:hypothetical protein